LWEIGIASKALSIILRILDNDLPVNVHEVANPLYRSITKKFIVANVDFFNSIMFEEIN